MKDVEISIEQKKREIIEDRLRKIRDAGHTGEINLWIKYLGEGKNTKKDFFSVEENYSGMSNEVFYEYANQMKELPLIRNELTNGKVIRSNNMQETPEETKEIDDAIQDIQRCIEDRYKEMKEIAKQLGIDENEINSISEIDLEQKIEDKKLENQEEKEQDVDEKKQISKEEAEKVGIKENGLNSVKMNTAIDTKGNTLGKELNLEEYDGLIVVHSYKLSKLYDAEGKSGKVDNINFAFVGKKKDGTLEVIPRTKLRPYKGANNEIIKENNKNEIETKKEECIFEVPNTNKRISIEQKDPYGIPEIYYGKTDIENERNIMERVQNERDGTQKTDVEVREKYNPNHGKFHFDRVKEEINDIENGNEEECNESNYKNADGNEKTANHLHEESIVDFEGIPDAKFEMIAKIEGGCENEEEIKELLERTNNILENENDDPEKAIKLAIGERNKEIIENSKEPEKVNELMKRTNVKNPNRAIEALEMTGWEIEEAQELLGRYKGEESN